MYLKCILIWYYDHSSMCVGVQTITICEWNNKYYNKEEEEDDWKFVNTITIRVIELQT